MKLITILTILISSLCLNAAEKSYVTTWTDKYDNKFSFVSGLKDDLFKELIIKNSRGPKWKEKAEEELERHYDFHEHSSYWGERVFEGMCGLNNEELEDAYEDGESYYKIKWKAIKRIKGNKKTVIYIAEHITVIEGLAKECEISEGEYLFLNDKKIDIEKRFLGERAYSIPRN